MNTNNQRAVIFIDGNNFYHSICAIGLPPPGVGFDYNSLSKKLVGAREWVETRYYIGRVRQEGDLTRYQKQRKFLAYLEQFDRINVSLGRLGRAVRGWLAGVTRRLVTD